MKKLILSLSTISLLYGDQIAYSLYNDFFVGTDEHFTNGAGVTWLEDNKKNSYTNSILNIAKSMGIDFNSSYNYNAGIGLSQIIVTPQNIELSTYQYNDTPYTGYLALSTYLIQSTPKKFYEYSIEIGEIGRYSFAQETQNGFHTVIGSQQAKGWNTQLKPQTVVNLFYQYGEISWEKQYKNKLQMDYSNSFGVNLGNYQTSTFIGSTFRIGKNYIQNFNTHYPYLKEEANLVGMKGHKGFGYSVSVGAYGELLAYSYILDEAKNEGYNSDKNTFNYSFYVSNDIYLNENKLSLFYQSKSAFTKNQNKSQYFGGFIYSYRF